MRAGEAAPGAGRRQDLVPGAPALTCWGKIPIYYHVKHAERLHLEKLHPQLPERGVFCVAGT